MIPLMKFGGLLAGGAIGPPTTWTFTMSAVFGGLTGHTGTQSAGSGGLADGVYNSTGGASITGTTSTTDSWIRADFGRPVLLSNMKVSPAKAADSWGVAYLDNRTLEYSIDGSSWTTLATVSGSAEGVTATYSTGGVICRYARVRWASVSNGYVGVSEFWFT